MSTCSVGVSRDVGVDSVPGRAWLDGYNDAWVLLRVRLRHHLPHARSMLMDGGTLLDHRDHWTTEPSPTTVALDLLAPAESTLYADLTSNTYGRSVRLEQERVSFSAVGKAVADG